MSDAGDGLFPTFGRSADALGRFMRSRGMRIAVLCAVGGFLFLAGLHGAAVLYEKAKVNAKVAELKAQRQPVVWTELVPKPVPEDQNAWTLYSKAADVIKGRAGVAPSQPFSRVERYTGTDWGDSEKLAAAAKCVTEDLDALALVKQAAARPQCWFEEDWGDPELVRLEHGSTMRGLARFAAIAAVVASRQGDQGEALDRLRVGFAIARYVRGEATLIDQLVAYAVDGIMFSAAGEVVGRGAVREGKARALAAELASGDCMAEFLRAEQMERCTFQHVFDGLLQHPSQMGSFFNDTGQQTSGMRWWCWGMLLRPLVYADELVYLKYMDKALADCSLPWRETSAAKTPERQDEVDVPDWAVVTQTLAMSPSRSAQRRDEAQARRALAGAALGVEMYKQKMGRYPATLKDVRKGIGWRIEADLFSGEDLVYRPIGTTYLLYSIGPDLRDDGGEPTYYQLPKGERGPAPSGKDRDAGDLVWMGTWKARK